MAASRGHAGGPASRTRHVGSAIVLLGMAVIATWNVVNNGNWIEVVLPSSPQFRADVSGACGLALISWAGGLGLLTRTSVGVWLGRLGAAVLLGLGAWFLSDSVGSTGITRTSWLLAIAVAVSALLMGAGIGILVALRPRADRRANAGRSSGSEV